MESERWKEVDGGMWRRCKKSRRGMWKEEKEVEERVEEDKEHM